MSAFDKTEYFDLTENRKTREDLKFSVNTLESTGVAVDCGCGAGADIDYLRTKGLTVFGFDIEPESISRCKKRFKDDPHVHLSQECFTTYNYPQCSLFVADSSLFFCPDIAFEKVWNEITSSIETNGLFCGSFLGPKDSMAHSENARIWPSVSVKEESQVKNMFGSFEILRWTEHVLSGEIKPGVSHDWHVFAVVARKT